jgi:hypothetical protein
MSLSNSGLKYVPRINKSKAFPYKRCLSRKCRGTNMALLAKIRPAFLNLRRTNTRFVNEGPKVTKNCQGKERTVNDE